MVDKAKMLDKLKILLGISINSEDELLNLFLDIAADTVMNYTRRSALITELESAVLRLAVVYYNKQGAEGQTSHSEGGVSRSYDSEIPEDIRMVLNRYIKARVI